MTKGLLPIVTFLLCFMTLGLQAQDADQIKADIAKKEGEIANLEGEIAALIASMPPVYGWKFGSAGTLGLNFSQFSKWLGAGNPNTSASSIGFSGNAFANLNEEKYFWRNDGNLTIGWTKLDTDTEDGVDADLENTADAINISSLYGYKLTEKIAISALGEYRSTIINNFNNPGYLDIGAGVTWLPIPDMVVVFHPLNYNIVFADDKFTYESSLGCKIVADYTRALPNGIAWKSKLSAFISYSDPSNYSNWTWINGFNATLFKKIGVGFEVGLRGNKQEGYNAFLADPTNGVTADDFEIDALKSDDNPLQTYWLLGFTYNL